MLNLLCFGFGYTAEQYVTSHGARFAQIIGTVRTGERADELTRRHAPRLIVLQFEDGTASKQLSTAVSEASFVLVAIPPSASGDPVLNACRTMLAQAQNLESIVYLSTIGVYGDHHGAWVNEDSACHPMTPRNRQRLEAELAWQAFSSDLGIPLAILRLSGIYGPQRNALVRLKQGITRNVIKHGQVFNRIHVFDIARAIDAAFLHHASGVFNVTDDEPSAAGGPIAFAAKLLGVTPPPEVPFEQAQETMSAMALTFYAESKRARNDRLKSVLGVELQYPTYREGLTALHKTLAN